MTGGEYMPVEVIVAIITLIGSAVGTFGGILATNKLTTYRIEQLEKKVEKHNNIMERTALLEKDMRVANHRIADLEKGVKYP